MIIRWVFESNGHNVTAALQHHTPGHAITDIVDQKYKAGDKDALLDVYFPERVTPDQRLPVVIWTHGGAWLSGDKTDAASYFKLLADAGFTVVAPNYSLAPEKSYPTPLHQLNAAYAYLQANAGRFRADTGRIILAGDSAGSQLSAQMAALITNPAYAREVGINPNLSPAQLRGVVLTCGIYKMEGLTHPDPTLPKIVGWGDDVAVWSYSGTSDFTDPIIRQMSPYYHATKDFPATFITGGNADPLTDAQSKPLANELERSGVKVTRLFYEAGHTPALPHEYQFNLDNADGQAALDHIINFLQQRTQ
jgi:acetyl esterase/lipase